jgi:hypothetical protein
LERLKQEDTMRSASIALAIAVSVVAAALAAQAGRPASSTSAWTRVSGPTQPGSQLGLGRTSDGVLHVIWNRGNSPTSIFETRLSAAGKAIGTSTVATGWQGNQGLGLIVMPDKTLRLFAPGQGGINTFTAPATGRSWTQQSGASWGGAIAESAYVIGVTLTKAGQPVTAWRGNAAEGAPPGSFPQSGYEGGMTESFLATDAASGAVLLSGATNAGQGGVYVQRILPSPGPRVVLPPLGKEWGNGLSGRIGAPGVYVAYADGKAVRLYRYGGGSKTVARGPYWSATVCTGPTGRLWVAWGDETNGLFVTRSNRAVSTFEPVQKLAAPAGPGLTFLQCEGSAGPVDVFADSGGFFHAHLLAKLSLRVHATKGKVTISARDAGDPVAGVAIAVGRRHMKTAANGQASLTLRPGSYSASATAPGYAPASARFSVR